jgi:hypothetical protein
MPSTTSTVVTWSEAVMTSTAAALAIFLGAIPKVIGFLLIVFIGWFVASAIAGIAARLLRSVQFNGMADRSGFSGFVQKMGMHTDASGFVADAAKWFVRLIVLTVAFDALGLPAVSQVLQQILLFIPNLIVALVVLIIGGLVANAFSRVVRGATAQAGFSNPEILATIARFAVWTFAIIIAVNQIGIATTLVNTLFMGFVGALALACGLAFGLGGRDTAGELVRSWYHGSEQATPKIIQTAQNAQEQITRERPAA